MRYLLSVLFLVVFTLTAQAQDSLSVTEDRWDRKLARKMSSSLFQSKNERSPKKAILLSAILPGAGQIYNKQYYKFHMVYAGLGSMLYAVDFNKSRYLDFRDAYANRLNNLPTPYPETVPDEALKINRDFYRKNLEWSYIGMGIVYIFNIADAFVSAHLSTFDVEDDLSIILHPSSGQTASGGSFTGIGISLLF